MKVGDLVVYKENNRGIIVSKEGDEYTIFFEALGKTVKIPESVMEANCLNWEVISEGKASE